MTAIVYPAGLPRMQLWPAVSRERRAGSGGEGIKAAPRARSRDRIADIDAQCVYNPAQMAVWAAWYEQTLLNGARWFAIKAPGPGGWLQRVCRYRTATVRREPLGGGQWRVSAQLEQRGRSQLPSIVAIDATVGYDAGGMALPPNASASSALILFVLHTLADTPTVDASWGVPVLNPSDSSGSWRLSVYFKTGGIAGAVAGAGLLQWAIVAINGIDDPHFPYDNVFTPPQSNSTLDNGGSGGVSVQGITYSPAADAYALVATFIFAPDTGGAVLTGDPPGYTNLAAQSRPYDVPLFPSGTEQYNAQIRIAYKLLSAAVAENPGDAAASPDNYASGGVGALIFGVRT
jgi:hypothetical protein